MTFEGATAPSFLKSGREEVKTLIYLD